MADPDTSLAPHSTPDEDLLDPCAAEIMREGRLLWRQHRKLEMVVTTIIAPVAAFLAAIVIGGGVFSWAAVLAGLVAACLSIPLVLGVLYGYYRVFEAPRSLYRKSREQCAQTNRDLEAQRGIVGQYATDLTNANYEKHEALERAHRLEKRLEQADIEKAGLQAHLAKLSERLLPKFQILFENELPYIEERAWDDKSSRKQTYLRVQVVNNSAKTIENVSVCIESFDAYGGELLFKNLPLRIMNNDSSPPRKFFSLHPDRGEFIDLARKDSSIETWSIYHAYEGRKKVETEDKDVTICIVATGLNALPAKRRFRLHVDSEGVLHCEPLDPVETISLPIVGTG